MRSLYLFLATALVFFANCSVVLAKPFKAVPAVQGYPSSFYGTDQLSQELDRIINAHNLNAQLTVYVKSMRHRDILYARNIHQALTPASTLKVFTAEAALLFLGTHYRFATQLLTDAKEIKNGILQGNLYIVLSGDPTLTYTDLLALLLTLHQYQIHTIAGNIYLDNTAYDQSFYGPGWVDKDKSYCYGAPISASIINHNCLALKITPVKNKKNAAQAFIPSHYFFPTIKSSLTDKTHTRHVCTVHLFNDPDSNINIDGCLAKGSYTGLSYVVTNIPDYNRALFKSLFSKLGYKITGSITFGSANNRLSLIGQHASEPLSQMVNELLKKSDNIIAGALFKKIGQLYTHKPGTWENGSLAVAQILSQHAQVDTSRLRILDGSGLSPFNLATSAQMMQVLEFAFHHEGTSYEFISSLPIAGVDGTLKHRMGHIARKVRAKTGTISGVVSLAGYALSSNKEPLGFVIIINGNKQQGWQFKSLEDQIVTALTHYVR